MTKKIIMTFFFIMSLNASAGIETHGGDAIAAEALQQTDHLLANLNEALLSKEERKILIAIQLTRSKVSIISEDRVFLDGIEKDAINTRGATLQITISRASWARLNDRQKRHLMLHELLPLSELIDTDYRISSQLISKISVEIDFDTFLKQLYFCNRNTWLSIKQSDLALLRIYDADLFSLSKVNDHCQYALEAFKNAGLDLNDCSHRSETLLSETRKERDFALSLKGRFAESYLKFEQRLVELGGSLQCSAPTGK